MAGLTKVEKRILNTLLDKYERSATFRGQATVKQSFSVKPEDVFEGYKDDARYDIFVAVNEAVAQLRKRALVEYTERNSYITKIILKSESIAEAYKEAGRVPKQKTLEQLADLLREKQLLFETGVNALDDMTRDVSESVITYIKAQKERMSEGKLPEYYSEEEEYEDMWRLLEFLSCEHEEVYCRDLSVRLYRDSKKLEAIKPKVESLLFKYGDFPEKEMVLAECSVISTPSYVMCKGDIIIRFGEQELDVGKLRGDVAFSGKTLEDITSVSVCSDMLVTVENLTTFHRYDPGNGAVLYLGGFHNRTKRDFLKMIYENNKGIKYYHFGDIDAGGFNIYEHLKARTGIPFELMNMDVSILEKYSEYTKKLTANDVSRIKKLIERYEQAALGADDEKKKCAESTLMTLRYMLEHNVKLEQEALE